MPAAFTSIDPVAGVGYATQLSQWQAVFANTIFLREKVQVGRMTASVTKNANTTFGDLTGLSFTVQPSEVWLFAAFLYAQAANATPNMKFTFTGPAAPTSVVFGVLGSGIPITAGFVSALGSSAIYTKGTVDEVLVLSGTIVNAANAGTMQAQFAQNTSNASNSVITLNSSILAVRID